MAKGRAEAFLRALRATLVYNKRSAISKLGAQKLSVCLSERFPTNFVADLLHRLYLGSCIVRLREFSRCLRSVVIKLRLAKLRWGRVEKSGRSGPIGRFFKRDSRRHLTRCCP